MPNMQKYPPGGAASGLSDSERMVPTGGSGPSKGGGSPSSSSSVGLSKTGRLKLSSSRLGGGLKISSGGVMVVPVTLVTPLGGGVPSSVVSGSLGIMFPSESIGSPCSLVPAGTSGGASGTLGVEVVSSARSVIPTPVILYARKIVSTSEALVLMIKTSAIPPGLIDSLRSRTQSPTDTVPN